MMNSQPVEALSLGRSSDYVTARVSEHLDRRSESGAEWYSIRDLDEVDRAVREGRLQQVVFDSLDQLLAGLWNGEIDAHAWLSAGVQIEFTAPATLDPPSLSRVLLANWQAGARRQRRRRVVAGVVLSLIAMAAAFFLNWVVGR